MKDSTPRAHWIALLLLAAVTALHQYQVWGWFIEDSAITFAFARNFADGEGLVPWPGGERIESVSNPTWTLIIAVGELFGWGGFDTAKPLSLGFSWLSLYLVYRLARRAIPDDQTGHWALLAPTLLATGSVYNMWAGSGLENALFGAVLAGGVLRMTQELEDGGRPWSSLIF